MLFVRSQMEIFRRTVQRPLPSVTRAGTISSYHDLDLDFDLDTDHDTDLDLDHDTDLDLDIDTELDHDLEFS